MKSKMWDDVLGKGLNWAILIILIWIDLDNLNYPSLGLIMAN